MKSPLLRALGMNVCRLRTEHQWNQETLAEKADVSVRQLQRIEAGEPDPGFLILDKICEALECGWDEMTKGLPELRTARNQAELENVQP